MNTSPILVLNSGSSSLKVAVFQLSGNDEQLLFEGSAEGIGRPDGTLQLRAADKTALVDEQHTLETPIDALQKLTSALGKQLAAPPVAVGHRVVHGGPHLREHTLITEDVLKQLEASVHFAPLHIPDAVKAIRETEQIYPQATQIACFDTAFHRTMPELATHLPIPRRFFEQGVQRFGFHGLSCESVMHRLGAGRPERIIIAHLGGGSSLTAIRNGQSVDTTMGMSPTGGIPMGTRTGDLDPGVLLFMLRSGMDVDSLERMVNHECGLAGLSGGESDMQALLAREATGNSAAHLAVEVFCTDIRKQIGAFAALLGGLDLLVFTGGIGQHSEAIRSRVTDRLAQIGPGGSDKMRVLAMGAEEEVQIARHCREILG